MIDQSALHFTPWQTSSIKHHIAPALCLLWKEVYKYVIKLYEMIERTFA